MPRTCENSSWDRPLARAQFRAATRLGFVLIESTGLAAWQLEISREFGFVGVWRRRQGCLAKVLRSLARHHLPEFALGYAPSREHDMHVARAFELLKDSAKLRSRREVLGGVSMKPLRLGGSLRPITVCQK